MSDAADPSASRVVEEGLPARTGLSSQTLSRLCKTLTACDAVTSVVLYGSRAKGTFRNGSDIDLTLIGTQLIDDDLRALMMAIDDLLLPYKVDLSIYSHIDNDALRKHIERVGIRLCG